MKHILVLISYLFIISGSVQSQTHTITTGKYPYQIVDNDPLNARIYKLDNGLTVFLTVNKKEPRIQTFIAVRAGSKNDPSDATGLAHYLEHMLFKGTDKYGSLDFSKEEPLINEIIRLYEIYRVTTNESDRKSIYSQIDSVSKIASTYAIANEYDRMMSYIGARGTNAYTSNEQTVYTNEIPSNQIENWLTIEAERFRNPVMRLFHTELEVVYEEKNRSLDNDASKLWDALSRGLFPKHQYGTQTTIGTIEDLKNPSIQKVIEYYHQYYVPNNMAISMSGDFNPDQVIEIIASKFGAFKPGVIPEFVPAVEDPILSPVEFTVYGPNPESLALAYRFDGANSREADLLSMIDMILSNSAAGLIDINLNQDQKILEGNSYARIMKDYSYLSLSGSPREGQSLNEVKDLLLEQIENIKTGNFPDWLPEAIVNNMKLRELRSFQNNGSRAHAFVSAFTSGQDWEYYIGKINRLAKITKQDIINFANEKFGNNYVVVYKRTGEDPNKIQIEKPQITPVEINRTEQSEFVQDIKNNVSDPIEPVFLDFSKDLTKTKMKNDIDVYYVRNNNNELFELYYVLDMGSNEDKRLPLALDYLEYLGTSELSPSEISREFYKLGCSFSVNSSNEQVYVSLTGLNNNFVPALNLFEKLLTDAQPNDSALSNLKKDIFKIRADNKLSKNVIQSMLLAFGQYGPISPATNILSDNELRNITSSELLEIIKSLTSYVHDVYYFGPVEVPQLLSDLNREKILPETLKPLTEKVIFQTAPTNRGKVYVVNYDMVQAEIFLLSQKGLYNKDEVPIIQLFNDYFGSGMSSVTFQELRESQALAYSTYAYVSTPSDNEKERFFIAYIGTQADKLPEALKGMMGLMNNLPESQSSFIPAQQGIISSIQSQRIRDAEIIFNYVNAQKHGLDYDIRRDIYEQVQKMTLDDIKRFHENFIRNSSFTMVVLGDKSKLNITELQKYGDVEFLELEDIFGY